MDSFIHGLNGWINGSGCSSWRAELFIPSSPAHSQVISRQTVTETAQLRQEVEVAGLVTLTCVCNSLN